MNAQTQPKGVAVICERHGDDSAAMEAYLQTQDVAEADWYAPRDVDDADKAVCEGRVGRVVFPNWPGFLDALWDEKIAFEHWLAAGVRVEFVTSPSPDTNTHLTDIFQSWQRWRQVRRRRQVAAGLLLSVVAVAAAFTLLMVL